MRRARADKLNKRSYGRMAGAVAAFRRAGTLAGEKETTPPYRWLVEVSGDAQARVGAPTVVDADRTAALEAENAGRRRELATLRRGEALQIRA